MDNQEALAYTLGYDLYRYDRTIPEDAKMSLINGWKEASRRFGKHKLKADKYCRKWLQVRTNALTRGKYFDEGIDPSYLKRIDTDICPVTLMPLTAGLGLDSDWSIDRALNEHDYVSGNLLVMSVLANKAKADRSYEEIVLQATTDSLYANESSEFEGLTQVEWQRLMDAVAPAAALAAYSKPQQYLSGQDWLPGQPYGAPARLQVVLTRIWLSTFSVHDIEERKKRMETFADLFIFLDSCMNNKDSRRRVRRMHQHMHTKRNPANSWQYWGNVKSTRLFVDMWMGFSKAKQEKIEDQLLSMYRFENGFEDIPMELHI